MSPLEFDMLRGKIVRVGRHYSPLEPIVMVSHNTWCWLYCNCSELDGLFIDHQGNVHLLGAKVHTWSEKHDTVLLKEG